MISVIGTSGLGEVAGVAADRPAGLLEAVVGRPDSAVLVLAPRYAELAARRQSDLLVAARPRARVRTVVSTHHPLTLTMIADRVQRSGVDAIEDAEALALALLAEARSLLWSPTLWRLGGVGLGLTARLRSLGGRPGWFLELGDGSRPGAAYQDLRLTHGQRLHGVDAPPDLLARRLVGSTVEPVTTTIHPGAPYGPGATRLLTVLPVEQPATARVETKPRPDAPVAHDPVAHDKETEAA